MPRRTTSAMGDLKDVHPRKSFVALLSAVALTVLCAPLSWSEASQPVVRTQTHVDSPHAVWEDGTFRLMSNSAGYLPIEDTVNWVSRGRVDGGLGAYAWRVPDDPRFDFLDPYDEQLMYFGGPAHGFPKNTMPIWAGFGAAADLPTEDFRAASFNMEIVDFHGPGKMELFNYSDEVYPLNRLWSSHDPGFRATWVNAGTHTHNSTTFTRPGRYEVTYRATARLKDGSFIHSEPQTLVWQVGGTNPADRTINDLPRAYSQANTSGTGSPTFQMRPAQGETKGAQEGILTNLAFDTGNPKDAGHVVFLINGFYLAEREVIGGKASWDEMIGEEFSDFQAVYIPVSGSPSPRWISAPLTFRTGAVASSTSERAEELPTPQMDDIAPFETEPFNITSPDVVVSTGEVYGEDDRNIDITVRPADDRTTLRVSGGFYRIDGDPLTELPEHAIADCEIEFTSAPGGRTSKQLVDGCRRPGHQLILKIVPEARSNATDAALFNHLQEADYSPIPETTVTLGEAPATPPAAPTATSEAPSPQPSSPAPSPAPSAEPSPSSTLTPAQEKVLNLHSGHVDIAPLYESGTLHLRVKDETNLYDKGAVWRSPSSVAFTVPKQVGTVLDDDIEGFAKAGEVAYILPETQRRGVVWPGLSTEHAFGETGKNYTFTLTPVSAPRGGNWIAFRGDQTDPSMRLAGNDATRAYTTDGPEHMHVSWAFNKPGSYEIGVSVAEVGGSTSKQEILRFVVAADGEFVPPTVPDTTGPDTTVATTAPAPTPAQTTAPTAAPTTSAQATTLPSSEPPAETTPVEITTGHVDFGPKVIDGKTGFFVHEGSTHHIPESVALRVFDARKTTIDQRTAQAATNVGFLQEGDTVYHLPLGQLHDAVWPGWDTMKVAETYPDGVNIEVRPKTAPTGGRWWAGHLPTIGVPPATLADDSQTHTITGVTPGNFHVHADWIFTQPGVYDIEMRTVSLSGEPVTEWSTVTYLVGDDTQISSRNDVPQASPSASGSPTPTSAANTTPTSSNSAASTPTSTTRESQRTFTRPAATASASRISVSSTASKRTTPTSLTTPTTQRSRASSAVAQGAAVGSTQKVARGTGEGTAQSPRVSDEQRGGSLASTGAEVRNALGLAIACLIVGGVLMSRRK